MKKHPNANEAIVHESETYLVACHGCGRLADAAQSLLCNCLGKERTPVCPHCGQCLCKLPAAQRAEFWRRAPAALRLRRKPERPAVARSTLAGIFRPVVLLVDDDEEIRLIGAEVIEKLGYVCLTADGAAAALAMLDTARPRVVITDALMPKMDGRQLCRLIKKSSSAKVVIMTSLYTGNRYKYEAYKKFGADEYLAKPIDFAELQATLERLMAPTGSEE